MTRTEPLRRMILQLRQIFLIDALTFMLLPQNKKPAKRLDYPTSLQHGSDKTLKPVYLCCADRIITLCKIRVLFPRH